MKTNGIRIALIAICSSLLMLIFSFSTQAQPDYYFNTPTYVSGPALNVGAKYRYNNVKSGVDAIVTITAITAGVTLTDIDGSSGYPEALQPDITVARNTNGYVELKIDFVNAGGNTAMTQLEVPTTCIDIDGDPGINEFDQIRMAGAYTLYDLTTTELKVTYSPGWVLVENIGNVTYNGRDTTQKGVMFTVVHGTTSSVTLRVGTNNKTSSSVARLRSIYFKKFVYPNSHLAANELLAFRGVENKGLVNLNWDLRTDNTVAAITLEKSADARSFHALSDYWLTEPVAQNGFRYTDNETLRQTAYYRLKLTGINGQVQYSTILSFRAGNNATNALRVYPSLVTDHATVSVTATAKAPAQMTVVDLNGRVVLQKNIQLQEGTSSVDLTGLDRLAGGTYAVVVAQEGAPLSRQKFIKQ